MTILSVEEKERFQADFTALLERYGMTSGYLVCSDFDPSVDDTGFVGVIVTKWVGPVLQTMAQETWEALLEGAESTAPKIHGN